MNEPCGICLEQPKDLLGILDCCHHVFCLTCLKHWHAKQVASTLSLPEAVVLHDYNQRLALLEGSHGLGSKATLNMARLQQLAQISDPARKKTSCPLCRQRSSGIFPAVSVPVSASQKAQLIQNYYRSKKRTLCKWFESSIKLGGIPSCPHWNDCLYAHLKPAAPNRLRKEEYVFSQEEIEADYTASFTAAFFAAQDTTA